MAPIQVCISSALRESNGAIKPYMRWTARNRMSSRKPYPLVSKLDTLLEIFLGSVQQIERRR